MTVSKLPQFTPEAAKIWATIPTTVKPQLLANVFCSHCRGAVKIVDFKGIMRGNSLVLNGHCAVCGNDVARVIED